jgi:hypothetical protein
MEMDKNTRKWMDKDRKGVGQTVGRDSLVVLFFMPFFQHSCMEEVTNLLSVQEFIKHFFAVST